MTAPGYEFYVGVFGSISSFIKSILKSLVVPVI